MEQEHKHSSCFNVDNLRNNELKAGGSKVARYSLRISGLGFRISGKKKMST